MASNKTFGKSTAVLLYIVFVVIDMVLSFIYCGRFLLPGELTALLLISKIVFFLVPVLWVIGKNSSNSLKEICEAVWFFGELVNWGVLFIFGFGTWTTLFPLIVFSLSLSILIGCGWDWTIKFMAIRKTLY